MYAMLFFLFSVVNGHLVCKTTYDEPIDGFHLWQRGDTLSCFEDGIKCRKNEYVCVIGNSTPPMIDDAYLLKYEMFKSINAIRCNTSRNVWTLENINMDPMNEATFVENDENRYIDIYSGHGNVEIFISGVNILFINASENGHRSRTNVTIFNNSFINRIENLEHFWTRIHLVPVKTFHAGVWNIILQFPNRENVKFYVNVESNLTCFDNILTTTCNDEEIPTTTELQCHSGQTFNKTPLENIVCKIQNETLISNNRLNFHFRINSSKFEGHVITCISSSSNQTWTSNPIRYFQSIENTIKMKSISNSIKPNCQYSWILPSGRIIPGRHLHRYFMTRYGTYYGTITCGAECLYINRAVNFNNPYTTKQFTVTPSFSATPTTTTDSTAISIELLNVKLNIVLVCGSISILLAFMSFHMIFRRWKRIYYNVST